MHAIGVIPARFAATRFEGKVLAPLKGKPMIQHVWQRAKQARHLEEVMIACDDQRILQTAQEFGAKVVLTAPSHTCGTDRIAEAVAGLKVDIVVNIQADEPLIHHDTIDDLVQLLIKNPSLAMATAIKAIKTQAELEDPNVVKVITDNQQYALYFSRSVIPYDRDGKGIKKIPYHKHLGIYAYRKDFLIHFSKMTKPWLEQAEQLEQLRALTAGVKIKTVVTTMETIGVDTPEDLARVEPLIK